MSNQIYSLGYQGWTLEMLKAKVEELDAYLVDIRLKPFSKDPSFSVDMLKLTFGERYRLCPSLGNVNYKKPGMENVEFKDWHKGRDQIERYFKKRNVIIMCACWQFTNCHRSLVAKRLDFEINQYVTEIWKPKKERPAPPKRNREAGFLFNLDATSDGAQEEELW